jgi:hypothetical protein
MKENVRAVPFVCMGALTNVHASSIFACVVIEESK